MHSGQLRNPSVMRAAGHSRTMFCQRHMKWVHPADVAEVLARHVAALRRAVVVHATDALVAHQPDAVVAAAPAPLLQELGHVAHIVEPALKREFLRRLVRRADRLFAEAALGAAQVLGVVGARAADVVALGAVAGAEDGAARHLGATEAVARLVLLVRVREHLAVGHFSVLLVTSTLISPASIVCVSLHLGHDAIIGSAAIICTFRMSSFEGQH